jgi:3-oxoadipate enol-lactonase
MPHFHHDSGSLHYLERGSGQPLLLIPGLGASGADWAMQVAALEGRFRVIVPDLPGCGHSGAITEDCSIPSLAASLWRLLDSLCGSPVNIIGFSLGGAVALEMALQRPACVPRLALINSLASYQIDDPRKWIEARLTCALISLFGMRMVGRLFAARLFPHPWQLPMRARAARVIGAVPAATYLALMSALERWNATGQLFLLESRILMISVEHDYVPLSEKRRLAATLDAQLIVIEGSRHGTPFDSIHATNMGLLALFDDCRLPGEVRWNCDTPDSLQPLHFIGSLAEEHATAFDVSRIGA